MVSNARDISNISRYSVKSWAHIAFSANILNVKTSSVLLRPGLYAAWDIDMTFLKRSDVLPTTIIARIFLRTDNKMTVLRFFAGPFGLFGFGNGIRCPNLISSGYLPVSATWLRISVIYWWITSGLYLFNSVCTFCFHVSNALYFLHSTSVLSFDIDVVLTLSIKARSDNDLVYQHWQIVSNVLCLRVVRDNGYPSNLCYCTVFLVSHLIIIECYFCFKMTLTSETRNKSIHHFSKKKKYFESVKLG